MPGLKTLQRAWQERALHLCRSNMMSSTQCDPLMLKQALTQRLCSLALGSHCTAEANLFGPLSKQLCWLQFPGEGRA